MQVSLVIPTHRRPDDLRRALASLEQQTLRGFEVLVVDNAGDEATRRAVADAAEALASRASVRYVLEPELGLHNARHAGAREARGDLLVFTDDDATFDEEWLAAYATAFADHPEMQAAGGPVVPCWAEPPPEWLTRLMGPGGTFPPLSLLQRGSELHVDPNGVFFGVNMAVRRHVLFALGGFNPDSFGDVWLGDGESGLNRKLWERDLLVGYVPGALVTHWIPVERMTRGYIKQRLRNEGACTEYARFRGTAPTSADLRLRRCVVTASALRVVLVTPLRRLLRRDESAWLKLGIGLAYNVGRLRYLARLSRDDLLRETVRREDWLTADGR